MRRTANAVSDWTPIRGAKGGWAAAGLALAAMAAANYALARRAERRHPPTGRFVTIDGVRLHYLDRGTGPVVVLLHGNGATTEDFVISGVFDDLARDHRVIAFDRPGFGFSERPRRRVWTAAAQADLLLDALRRLDAGRAVPVGHSWGTHVALAMAMRAPAETAGLVLMSGYYYPSARADVVLAAPLAMPVLGDAIRYTVAPLLGRVSAPAVYRKLFAPSPVCDRFAARFPLDLALRPWQLKASAAEAALMIPGAAALAGRYPELAMPTAIVAGTDDKMVDFGSQPTRLREDIPGSMFREIRAGGHMIHHTHPDVVVAAIREIAKAGQAEPPKQPRAP